MKRQQHMLMTLGRRFGGEPASAAISVRTDNPATTHAVIELINSAIGHYGKHCDHSLFCLSHVRELPSRPPDVELIETDELIRELHRRSASCIIGLAPISDPNGSRLSFTGNSASCVGMGYEVIRRVNDAIDQARNNSSNPTNPNSEES